MTDENLEITPEMNLEEFSRGVKDMLKEVRNATDLMDASLKSSLTNASKIVDHFQRLASIDASRTFQVDASGVAKQVGMSAEHQKVLNDALEESVAIWDRKSKLIDTTAGMIRLSRVELDLASEATKASLNPMRKVEQSARRLKAEVTQVRGELIRLKPVPLTEDSGGNGGLIKPALLLAGAAAAGKITRSFDSMLNTTKGVGGVLRGVGSNLDQFRQAATAPVVNPQLNILEKSVSSVGNTTVSVMDTVRGSLTAIAKDPLAALHAAMDALNGMVEVGNDAVSSLADIKTEAFQIKKIAGAFGIAEDKVDAFIETLQGGLLAASGSGAETLAKMNGAAHALGEEMRNLSGQSQQTAFAQEHLNKASHIGSKAMMAKQASAKRLASVVRFLKLPYTAVAEAVELNSRAVKEFREEADKLPGGKTLNDYAANAKRAAVALSKTVNVKGFVSGMTSIFTSTKPVGPGLRSVEASLRGVAKRANVTAKATIQMINPTNAIRHSLLQLRSATVKAKAGLSAAAGVAKRYANPLNILKDTIGRVEFSKRGLTKALFELNFATRPIRKSFTLVGTAFLQTGKLGLSALNGVKNAAVKVPGVVGRVASSVKSMASSFIRGVAGIQQFRANSAILRSELTRVERVAQRTGTTIKNVFFFPKSLFGGLTKTIFSSGFALKAAASAALLYGANASIAAEQTHVQFATMLRSGDQAKALMRDLEKRSALTPFSKDALIEGTKQLLTAQVPVDQIGSKLQVLGDIAAGTNKPIREFARIYAKAANTGKVSQDIINQFAERGVPIYQALATQLGVNRSEMLKMVRGGKVGFADLEGAITSTATGTGLFAGGMKALSETAGGLISTLKDNVGLLLKDVSGAWLEAFNFKGVLSGAISFVQGLRNSFGIVRGVIGAVADTVKTGLRTMWGVAKSVFTGLASGGTMAASVIGEKLAAGFAAVRVGIKNFRDVAALAWLKIELGATSAVENMRFAFSAIMDWLKANWESLFKDLASLSLVIIKNMMGNASSELSKLVDVLRNPAAAGAALATGNLTLDFDVDKMTDELTRGFKSSVSSLPQIARSGLTGVEENLQETIAGMESSLGAKVNEEVNKAVATYQAALKKQAIPALKNITADQTGRIEEQLTDEEEKREKSRPSGNIAQTLNRGSRAALEAVFNANSNDRLSKQQLAEEKKQTSLMKKFVSKDPVQLKVLPGVP